MNAGHVSENLESSGDLNRPRESRGSQPSGVLLVLFVQAKRIKTFPFREIRGFPNLEAAHRNGGFARTKLKPFQKEIRGFANLESAHQNQNFVLTQLNPLPLRGTFGGLPPKVFPSGTFPTFCKVQKVGQKTFPPYGGVPAGTAHSVCIVPPPAAQKGPQPSRLRSFLTRFARPLCTIAVRILRLPFPRVLAHIL